MPLRISISSKIWQITGKEACQPWRQMPSPPKGDRRSCLYGCPHGRRQSSAATMPRTSLQQIEYRQHRCALDEGGAESRRKVPVLPPMPERWKNAEWRSPGWSFQKFPPKATGAARLFVDKPCDMPIHNHLTAIQ